MLLILGSTSRPPPHRPGSGPLRQRRPAYPESAGWPAHTRRPPGPLSAAAQAKSCLPAGAGPGGHRSSLRLPGPDLSGLRPAAAPRVHANTASNEARRAPGVVTGGQPPDQGSQPAAAGGISRLNDTGIRPGTDLPAPRLSCRRRDTRRASAWSGPGGPHLPVNGITESGTRPRTPPIPADMRQPGPSSDRHLLPSPAAENDGQRPDPPPRPLSPAGRGHPHHQRVNTA